ncbi:MAG: hypothetical protein Q7S35_04470 [Candidatus Limnocylindrales bacterium]|nr:hypothetical protein [Candidatus Limnocylindrales bacterium]
MDESRTDLVEEPNVSKPWPEARGPHVPDPLGRIPGLAWIFIVLAVGRMWLLIDSASLGPAPEFLTFANFVMGAIASVAALLLPAVLLIRHPDAASRARTLLLGAILFAVGEGLQVLGERLWPFFLGLTPQGDDLPYLFPLAIGYNGLASLIATSALAGIGLGLARARRFGNRGATRSVTLLVLLPAGLLVVSRIVTANQLLPGEPRLTPDAILYASSTVVLGILSILAWAYLALTALRGRLAGEEPRIGWSLGALSAVLALAASEVFAALAIVALPELSVTGYLFLLSGLFALGPLALLAAFAFGLPSLESAVAPAAEAG